MSKKSVFFLLVVFVFNIGQARQTQKSIPSTYAVAEPGGTASFKESGETGGVYIN